MSPDSASSDPGGAALSSSSFLDEWLRKRQEQVPLRDSGAMPEGPLDINKLLPDDTSIESLERDIGRLVKGQASQVREISVLLSMHLAWARDPDPLHQPPNAIALGPTGSGKTFTLKTAATNLSLPFISVDTTALVPSGIVGLQIEDVLRDLVTLANDILQNANVQRTRNDDLQLAERGIIVFDEFDKVATSDKDAADNTQVQRRLLKLCEGSNVPVGLRRHSAVVADERTINTRGILIVGAGAFEGIEKVRAKRPQTLIRRTKDRDRVFSVDIQNFGFIPELVARLPVLIQYGKLTHDDLVQILKDPDTSPLSIWRKYIESLGCSLSISPEALDTIADRALEAGLGARGLQQVIFPVLAQSVAKNLSAGSSEGTKLEVHADDFG